jgi:methanogenic corrinoid protein MtbC1
MQEEQQALSSQDCGCDMAALVQQGAAVPLSDAPWSVPNEPLQRMTRLVEAEILPRLLQQSVAGAADTGSAQELELPDDLPTFLRLLRFSDYSVAAGFIDELLDRNIDIADICLRWLTPAARQLGELWEQDEADFMQVTVALCRLHQLLHRLGTGFHPQETVTGPAALRRALLSNMPGDPHTFGVVMLGQFLRHGGWDTWNEFPNTILELVSTVSANWFNIVGLSVGSDRQVDDLQRCVREIRRASRNQQVVILLGGPLILTQPHLVKQVGADGTATDGADALQWMRGRFPDFVKPV